MVRLSQLFAKVLKGTLFIIPCATQSMKITTKTSFLGFILAVSTLSTVSAQASTESLSPRSTNLDIEQRLARLTATIQQQTEQLNDNSTLPNDAIAGWGNIRGGGGGFANNRGGGGFVNNRGGGGFINNSWGDGGRFYNRY